MAATFVSTSAIADVQAGVEAWKRGDYAAAIAQWRTEALTGDAMAQFNLGQAYKLGRGVAVDLRQAEEWYRLAAVQGLAEAENNYAYVLFENGKRKEAMPWIRKAAGRGDARAQYVLGTAFFNGDLAERDWPRAYALMRLAVTGGVAQAKTSLAHMEKFVPAEDRKRGLALAAGPLATLVPDGKPVTQSPAPQASPRPVPSGKWRVQLGAFSQEARARKQWDLLTGRIDALTRFEPQYVRTDDVVRLQIGPVGAKKDANRLCETVKSAGSACFPVAP